MCPQKLIFIYAGLFAGTVASSSCRCDSQPASSPHINTPAHVAGSEGQPEAEVETTNEGTEAQLLTASSIVLDTDANWDVRWGTARRLGAYVHSELQPTIPLETGQSLVRFMDRSFERVPATEDRRVLGEAVIALELIPLDPSPARLLGLLELLRSHPDRVDSGRIDDWLVLYGFQPYVAVLEQWTDAILQGGARELAYGEQPRLESLARLGGTGAITRVEQFGATGWSDSTRFRAAEALALIEDDEALAALRRMRQIPATARIRKAIARALIAHDDIGGILLLAEAIGSPSDRDWASVENAANRAFGTIDEVRQWVAEAPTSSIRGCALREMTSQGYRVGDLSEDSQVAELLRAASDASWRTRRVAWNVFVHLVDHDPSGGRFWTVTSERPEGLVEEVTRAPETAPAGYQDALRTSQEEHLRVARLWLEQRRVGD